MSLWRALGSPASIYLTHRASERKSEVSTCEEVCIEARILNKEIGFIREGQPVRVKLEAYPFSNCDIVPGVVESISRDAVDTSEPGAADQRDRNGRVVQPGLVFTTRIRLLRRSIRVAGRDRPMGPGLAVQAEIKTGDRRNVQYLLSPIVHALDEAGHER